MPDNVLFEGGAGRLVRADLMSACDLHTILRLPNGIFYSQGVNTNVLFFSRRDGNPDNSERIWVYDMRAAMPRFGRTRPLSAEHFAEFETLFGDDPLGRGSRSEGDVSGRWRSFGRAQVRDREENLDLIWLAPQEEDAETEEGLPQEIASTILFHLQTAMAEVELLADELASEESER